MRATLLAALALLAISRLGSVAAARAAPAAPPNAKPWFCHDLDCPDFQLVKNISADVELRAYPGAKWASTIVKGVGGNYDKAVAAGFWRLFRYISGANEPSIKVAMTAPVTVRVIPAQGPACEDEFQVSFYVPREFQADPPKPSAAEVFIEERPGLLVYVKSFGGWATGATYLQTAAAFAAELEAQGHATDTDHFYTAGYDSPFRLRERHNEVWLLAAHEPSVAAE